MKATVALLLAFAGFSSALVYQHQLKHVESAMQKLIREGKWPERFAEKAAARSTGGEGVTDYDDVVYVATVQVGTPAQNFDVILDTGSSNFWVPDATCRVLACSNKHKFNGSASSTYSSQPGQSFTIQYGTGSARGVLATDKLCLGEANLCYNTQVFGRATSIADFFRNQPLDGILGLGWPALAVDHVTPPMQNLLPTLDMPVFTVFLSRVGAQDGVRNGGLFTYGAVDSTNCDSTWNYVPLSSQTYWQFVMSGVSAGSYSQNTNWQVISDTGTSFIGSPQTVANNIAQQMHATYNNQYGLYMLPCNSNVPNVVFTIGGQQYTIPKDEFVEPLTAGSSQCYLTWFGFNGGGFGPTWILGDTFIRTYCNLHDVGQARIGFAQSHNPHK